MLYYSSGGVPIYLTMYNAIGCGAAVDAPVTGNRWIISYLFPRKYRCSSASSSLVIHIPCSSVIAKMSHVRRRVRAARGPSGTTFTIKMREYPFGRTK